MIGRIVWLEAGDRCDNVNSRYFRRFRSRKIMLGEASDEAVSAKNKC